jgi:hypothetical protein
LLYRSQLLGRRNAIISRRQYPGNWRWRSGGMRKGMCGVPFDTLARL